VGNIVVRSGKPVAEKIVYEAVRVYALPTSHDREFCACACVRAWAISLYTRRAQRESFRNRKTIILTRRKTEICYDVPKQYI